MSSERESGSASRARGNGGAGRSSALPKQLAPLLSQRPLIPGEDSELYDAFLARVREDIAPADVIEHSWVKDIVDLIWEIQRYRRLRASLFFARRRDAIREVLIGFIDVGSDPNGAERLHVLAMAWAREDEAAVDEVNELLQRNGANIDMVMMRVLAQDMDIIERIDRMIASAELRRDSMLRDIERWREAVARRIEAAIEAEPHSVRRLRAPEKSERS